MTSAPGSPALPATAPISVDQVLAAGLGLSEVRTDGTDVLWLENRPTDNGRGTIMRLTTGTAPAVGEQPAVELSPQLDVRSRVMEYGGGAWSADGGAVAACDDRTRQLWLLRDGVWAPLTEPNPDVRYGDLRLHLGRNLLLAIAEDHTGVGTDAGPTEPVTRIVAVDLPTADDPAPRTPWTLVEGADFYSDPELSDDDVLAWCQWDHPNMPWDQTELHTALLGTRGRNLGGEQVVSEGTSALHPRWTPAGLMYVSDRSGFWNWRLHINGHDGTTPTTRAISKTLYDHEDPMWTLGNNTWAAWPPADPRVVVGLRYREGQAQIVTAALDDAAEHVVPVPHLAGVSSLAASDDAVWAVLGFTNRPAEVVRLDPGSGAMTTLATAGPTPDQAGVRAPEAIWADSPHGGVQGWLHAPTAALDDALPPLIVMSHGGPTAMALPDWSAKVQYWTGRGFAVLDVNYGGSTGFGRDYRNRLRGAWGIVDVDDCRALVEDLIDKGRIDAARVAITGGSAGGYTTLQSLVTTSTYTAGVSRYGIGDLGMLATDTHKFESRYLDGLVGPWPGAKQVYADRSPILHVDKLATPMLILQGTDDLVVPPGQARSMADAVKAAGQPVALVMFEGEGHGFRSMDARRRALLAEHAFYVQLWGLETADDLPPLSWL
ncbi:alpha/beta hydrolase family protein [Propionibacteriaceae bacterium G57]|uniref:alpha/beta hydrolase family protein n=1 Tax=Aestuariimicrobium sp. G57 TaxID=3418485 RepID=UPI003DA77347